MTPLRQRMIEDMCIRNFAGTTQRSYIHCICLPCRRPSFAAASTARREHPVDLIDGESVRLVVVTNPIL